MSKAHRFGLLLVGFAVISLPLLLSEPAPAAGQPAKPVDPVILQMQQELERLRQRVDQLEQALRSALAPEEKLSVTGFTVEGSQALDKTALEAVLQPVTTRKMTLAELQAEAKKMLQDAYAKEGIRGVQVVIPPQEITDKPLTVQVVEPKLGNLAVTGNKYFKEKNVRRFFEGKITTPEGVLDADGFEKQLDRANRHPDRQITALLKPGEQAGVTDVTLNVQERKSLIRIPPFHYAAELNNTGTPNTGRLRLENTFQYTNFFNRDHTGTFQWVFNPENYEDVQVMSMSYVIPDFLPWVPFELSLAFYGGISNVTGETTVDMLDIVGEGFTMGVQATAGLPKFLGMEHGLTLGIEGTELENSLQFGSFTSIDSEIGTLPIYLRYALRRPDPWGSFIGDFTIRYNVSGVVSHGDQSDFEKFREDSEASFWSIQAGIERYQKLPLNWTLHLRAEGQFCDDRLIPAEQFRLGGVNTVRGYEQSEVTGDSCALVRAELLTPELPPILSSIFKGKKERAQLSAFLDYGVSYSTDPLPGDPDGDDILGAGVGVRYQFLDHFTGKLDVGFPLLDSSRTSVGDPFLHFIVQLNF